MAVRALSFAGIDTRLISDEVNALLQPFADAGEVDWAKAELASAVKSGLLKGNTEGKLNPSDDLTRAEAAAIIERILIQAGFIAK